MTRDDRLGAEGGGVAAKRCPICGKPARLDFDPFCSRRCKEVDLNRWLGGVYAIPAEGPVPDEDGEDRPGQS